MPSFPKAPRDGPLPTSCPLCLPASFFLDSRAHENFGQHPPSSLGPPDPGPGLVCLWDREGPASPQGGCRGLPAAQSQAGSLSRLLKATRASGWNRCAAYGCPQPNVTSEPWSQPSQSRGGRRGSGTLMSHSKSIHPSHLLAPNPSPLGPGPQEEAKRRDP